MIRSLSMDRIRAIPSSRAQLGVATGVAIALLLAGGVAQDNTAVVAASTQLQAAIAAAIPQPMPVGSTLATSIGNVNGPLPTTYISVAPNTNVSGVGSRVVISVAVDGSKSFDYACPGRGNCTGTAAQAWAAVPSAKKQTYMSVVLDAASTQQGGVPLIVRVVVSGTSPLLLVSGQDVNNAKTFSQDEVAWSSTITW